VPQTLLLADDSLTIQRVIELTFAGEDIKVVAVSDGDQAIAQLDTMPPDIVLADVGMPGRNGYDVAQHVKQSPDLAHIPVILLTGAFEPVDKAKASAVGCDAVLAKPFEPQIVIGRVRELLSRPAQAGAPAIEAPPPVVAVEAPVPVAAAPAAEPAAPVAAEPPAPLAPPAPEPPPSHDQRVEDYFDRLDAAFASLVNAPAPSAPSPAEEEPDLPLEPQSFVVADELAAESAERVERLAPIEPFRSFEPLEPLEPREPLEPLGALELFAPLEPVVPSRVVEVPPAPRALPTLTDAFAAILSAERNVNAARPEWPLPKPVEPPPPVAPPEPVITDEVIDRIAKRVIEQLSDRVVRETVAQIASDVAERLVREEIERIKAAVEEK
jgi:CheY-like chemotaxis protein